MSLKPLRGHLIALCCVYALPQSSHHRVKRVTDLLFSFRLQDISAHFGYLLPPHATCKPSLKSSLHTFALLQLIHMCPPFLSFFFFFGGGNSGLAVNISC